MCYALEKWGLWSSCNAYDSCWDRSQKYLRIQVQLLNCTWRGVIGPALLYRTLIRDFRWPKNSKRPIYALFSGQNSTQSHGLMWYRGQWDHLYLSRYDSKLEGVFEGAFESDLNSSIRVTAFKALFFDSIAHCTQIDAWEVVLIAVSEFSRFPKTLKSSIQSKWSLKS